MKWCKELIGLCLFSGILCGMDRTQEFGEIIESGSEPESLVIESGSDSPESMEIMDVVEPVEVGLQLQRSPTTVDLSQGKKSEKRKDRGEAAGCRTAWKWCCGEGRKKQKQ